MGSIGSWMSPSVRMTAACGIGRQLATWLSCARSPSTSSVTAEQPRSACGRVASRPPGMMSTGCLYGPDDFMRRPCPEVTLESLRLRTGARFPYEYDRNIPWRHEVRLEDRLEPVAGQAYPTCIAGPAGCPPGGCGGPAGYHVRRDAWRSLDALEDIHTMADIVEQAVLERRPEVLDEAGTRWALEQALARVQAGE